MINKIILLGNVGQDPEIKNGDGWKIASFSLATTEKWKNKQGEIQYETEWHNIKVSNKLAEVVEKFVKKGSKLYIEGRIKTRSYEKDGNTIYTKDVICRELKMLDSKKDSEKQQKNNNNQEDWGNQEGDDDLPF